MPDAIILAVLIGIGLLVKNAITTHNMKREMRDYLKTVDSEIERKIKRLDSVERSALEAQRARINKYFKNNQE